MSRREITRSDRLFAGGAAVAMGGLILLVGLGVLKPEGEVHAPLWVVSCAGGAFMLAGASVLLSASAKRVASDGALPSDAPLGARAGQLVLSLLALAALASVATWIAVGPGARAFTVTASWGGEIETGLNELIGRVIFGAGALLAWLAFLAFARQGLRRLRQS